MWCNPLRGCKKCCEGAWISFCNRRPYGHLSAKIRLGSCGGGANAVDVVQGKWEEKAYFYCTVPDLSYSPLKTQLLHVVTLIHTRRAWAGQPGQSRVRTGQSLGQDQNGTKIKFSDPLKRKKSGGDTRLNVRKRTIRLFARSCEWATQNPTDPFSLQLQPCRAADKQLKWIFSISYFKVHTTKTRWKDWDPHTGDG